MFLTGGGWQGRVTTKMWLLREEELTRLKTVAVTRNSPVLQTPFRPLQTGLANNTAARGRYRRRRCPRQDSRLEGVLLCAASGP